MANIGTFKKSGDNNFTGELHRVRIRIVGVVDDLNPAHDLHFEAAFGEHDFRETRRALLE